MNSFFQDIRRTLRNPWFFVSVLITILTLWLGLGDYSYRILHIHIEGISIAWLDGIQTALSAQIATIALPTLSALPFAANAFLEIYTGASRMAVFRAGSQAYCRGKAVTCCLSGMLIQLLALCGFVLLLYLFSLRANTLDLDLPIQAMKNDVRALFPSQKSLLTLWPCFLDHIVCAGVWACIGGSMALLTKTSMAAYVGPMMISFCLSFIRTRFQADLAFLSLSTGSTAMSNAALAVLLLISVNLFYRILKWEIKKHA